MSKRLPGIIVRYINPERSLENDAAYYDKPSTEPDAADALEDEDDFELLLDLMDTELPESQREIFMDWLNDMPIETITTRARERSPESMYSSRGVQRSIEQAKELLKNFMRRLGVVDTDQPPILLF